MSEQLAKEFDRVRREMFEEAQQRLPEQDRVAPIDKEFCYHENDGYKCTKAIGHQGLHMAHGTLGTVLVKW